MRRMFGSFGEGVNDALAIVGMLAINYVLFLLHQKIGPWKIIARRRALLEEERKLQEAKVATVNK
jgi:hypothetical protein